VRGSSGRPMRRTPWMCSGVRQELPVRANINKNPMEAQCRITTRCLQHLGMHGSEIGLGVLFFDSLFYKIDDLRFQPDAIQFIDARNAAG
jgi:hypothetical protein